MDCWCVIDHIFTLCSQASTWTYCSCALSVWYRCLRTLLLSDASRVLWGRRGGSWQRGHYERLRLHFGSIWNCATNRGIWYQSLLSQNTRNWLQRRHQAEVSDEDEDDESNIAADMLTLAATPKCYNIRHLYGNSCLADKLHVTAQLICTASHVRTETGNQNYFCLASIFEGL